MMTRDPEVETRQSPEPGPILHHASRKWLLENGPKGMSAAQTARHLLIQVTGVEGSFLPRVLEVEPAAPGRAGYEGAEPVPAATMPDGGARGW